MSPKILGYLILILTVCLMPGTGMADSFLSPEQIKKTNVVLEMQGFAFTQGMDKLSNGKPSKDGMKWIPTQWSGSGFIVDEDGTLITNYHVANHAVGGWAVFSDGARYRIDQIKAFNRYDDLAVLKITSTKKFPHVELGNSDTVKELDDVLSVGNPQSMGLSFTKGQVSQIVRDLNNYPTMIRHTATISQGNSGGALYRGKEVIGVNVSMVLNYAIGGASGFFNAIPVNRVRSILKDSKDWTWVPLKDHFNPNDIPNRLKEIYSTKGKAPADTGKEMGGVVTIKFQPENMSDYLISIKSPGKDLALTVISADGKDLVGVSDIRGKDYESLVISASYARNMIILISNYYKTPSPYELYIDEIKW